MKTGIGSAYRRVCLGLCNIVSQKTREKHVYPLLDYAGVAEDADFYLGKMMVLGMLFGLIGLLVVYSLPQARVFFPEEFVLPVALVSAVSFVCITIIAYYMYIYYLIDGRKKMAEKILPDFLLLVSSNVRAGMTPFAAFRNSARKEFGPLSDEVRIATSKSLGTESFSEAIKSLSKRIASDSLRETVAFFGQALRSGGKIAKLLETTAADLRQSEALRKELISSTRMYVMFVVFVVVIATPILLSVSVQFLEMISTIQEETGSSAPAGMEMGFLSAELGFDAAFLQTIAFILLFGNSLLSSLFIGVIGQGKAKNGVKYFPVLFAVSAVVLFASRAAFSGFLSV